MRFHTTVYIQDGYECMRVNNVIAGIENDLWNTEDALVETKNMLYQERDEYNEIVGKLNHANKNWTYWKEQYDALYKKYVGIFETNKTNFETCNRNLHIIDNVLRPRIVQLEEFERRLLSRINDELIPLIDKELRPRIAQLKETELKHVTYVNETLVPLVNEKLLPRISELEKSEKDLTSQLQAMKKAMEALEAQNAALRAENTSMREELVTAHYDLVEADSAERELYHEVEHLERERHEAQQPVVQQPAGA